MLRKRKISIRALKSNIYSMNVYKYLCSDNWIKCRYTTFTKQSSKLWGKLAMWLFRISVFHMYFWNENMKSYLYIRKISNRTKKLNLYFNNFFLWTSEYICILRKYQIFEIHSAVCGQYVLACLRYPNMKYENGFDTGGTWCHYIVNTIMMTTLDILFIWTVKLLTSCLGW